MELPHEPQRERQRPQSRYPVFESRDVVPDVSDIGGFAVAGPLGDLLQEEFRQGCQRPLDARRQHRLAAHVRCDHDARIGQVSSQARQLTEGGIGFGECEHDIIGICELRGERRRDERVIAAARADHPAGFRGAEVRRVHRWSTTR